MISPRRGTRFARGSRSLLADAERALTRIDDAERRAAAGRADDHCRVLPIIL
jgi:hypothetical protein